MTVNFADIFSLAPAIILVLFAFGILFEDIFTGRSDTSHGGVISLVGLVFAFLTNFLLWDGLRIAFNGAIHLNHYCVYMNFIFIVTAGFTVLMSGRYTEMMNMNRGEYYSLILIATAAMMVMGAAMDLVTFFIALETMSIAVYVLAGFRRDNARANEAAFKYFLVGAFATGFLLYGMALVFGTTGTTNYDAISKVLAAKLAGEGALSPLFWAGLALIVVGLAFKVSAVPFHMWTPDVYEGSATPITAFMAVGVKAAAFAAAARLFITAFGVDYVMDFLGEAIAVIAVLTMTVGNIMAIAQKNLKRMLAYSSIAHAGYILLALVAGTKIALSSMLFYFAAYALMNLGAFACIILTSWKDHEGDELKDFQGMGFEKPGMGIVMTIFMLSLAGIPPTMGFVAKFYLFVALAQSQLYLLIVIAALNAAISIYYYLRVIIYMYMMPPEGSVVEEDRSIFARGILVAFTLIVAAGLTIALGIFPNHLWALAREAAILSYINP